MLTRAGWLIVVALPLAAAARATSSRWTIPGRRRRRFAQRPDVTTFSHTSNGDSQNAGAVWTPIAHPGHETLVQVVMVPD